MPRTKKIIRKKQSLQSPMGQVAYLKDCIQDCQHKLSMTFKKTINTTKKQQEQLKNKLAKAKHKLSTIKAKSAKVIRNKSDKDKTAIKTAQQAIKQIELELLKNKQDLVNLQQDEKKFHAAQKALAQFEKQWKSKTKAPQKKAVTKSKNKHTEEKAPILMPETAPFNEETTKTSPEEIYSEFRFATASATNKTSEE